MLELYKIVYRCPFMGSVHKTNFCSSIADAFSTYEEALEALVNKGHELESEMKSTFITKADIYEYSTEIVNGVIGEDRPMKAVVIQKNKCTFESSPIAYLQIIKV